MSEELVFDLGIVQRTPQQAIDARRVRYVEPRIRQEAQPGGSVFSVVSLASWLDIAAKAGVNYVPACRVLDVDVGAVLFGRERGASVAHVVAIEECVQALEPHEMLRWDCCAGLDLKIACANGMTQEPLSLVDRGLHTHDPRFLQIVYEYPFDTVGVYRRPWVDARQDGLYPVEYRVFVQGGVIRGVSNYYLQRAMVLDDRVKDEVRQCLRASAKMIEAIKGHGLRPYWHECEDDSIAGISMTLDFLVEASSGDVVFLEGGPAFGLGAHPCCFVGSERGGQICVDGLALSAENEASALCVIAGG